MGVGADNDAGSGGGELRRQRQLRPVRAGLALGSQCMNTMTTGASRRAARTAARVRGRSMALASPGRLGVATQDEASSATCETPTTANLTPLMVLT